MTDAEKIRICKRFVKSLKETYQGLPMTFVLSRDQAVDVLKVVEEFLTGGIDEGEV